ncbi:hypothetical protein GGS24DRAFT_336890 [Hypoxylon argillaceum]|nr:hypothetical protein GGS24DRAFT_336890 [Hypoxylon argillaceum]
MTGSCSSESNHACPLVNMSGTVRLHPSTIIEPSLTSSKAPGKRCPTCRAAGREVWVFAGRSCPVCATYVA